MSVKNVALLQKEKEFIKVFKKNGYQLIDQLAEYLENSHSANKPVVNLHEPDIEIDYWQNVEIRDLNDFHSKLIKRSIRLHHPNYIGHQVSAPLPDLALLGLTSDLMNNGMGIYEMGSAAVAIEHIVIQTFSKHIGYNTKESNGFLTSGGTLANLTALLAARSKLQSEHPQIPNSKIHLLVSEQAHFCVQRAWATMGLKDKNLHTISVNESYQVDIDMLKSTINEIISRGDKIMAIVGCACSTATGSYDDISALTSICQESRIWLHIDGAHGGAAIFSEKLKKKLFNGVHLADSIIIDAHKMMLTPALATAVLFKNHVDGYNSFKQKADYLFNKSDIDPHNLAKRTYETTKYMMSIKVYYLLKMYGVEYIGQFVERQTNLAIWYYNLLTVATDFECAHKPQTNILCFRYVDESISELNELNQFIRQQLLNEGSFYIVSTILRDSYYLRVSIMNPATTEHHLTNLVSKIRSIAAAYPNR